MARRGPGDSYGRIRRPAHVVDRGIIAAVGDPGFPPTIALRSRVGNTGAMGNLADARPATGTGWASRPRPTSASAICQRAVANSSPAVRFALSIAEAFREGASPVQVRIGIGAKSTPKLPKFLKCAHIWHSAKHDAAQRVVCVFEGAGKAVARREAQAAQIPPSRNQANRRPIEDAMILGAPRTHFILR